MRCHLTPHARFLRSKIDHISANSKQNSKRLQPVNQGPRGYCLMNKNRGSKISWNCSFKILYFLKLFLHNKKNNMQIFCLWIVRKRLLVHKCCNAFSDLIFREKFSQKLSRKFRIFVTNISRKRKVSFRENTKTKTFVPTLLWSHNTQQEER
jgi:hypothetical protein